MPWIASNLVPLLSISMLLAGQAQAGDDPRHVAAFAERCAMAERHPVNAIN